MQTFLHYRWRVPSTLHRLHLRRIIPLLILALCVTGAKAADVPSTWKPVTFNEDIRYSQWVINSRISDFYAKDTKRGFNTYDKDGKWISNSEGTQAFDYVPGLVAKAVLEAYANYSTFDWSKPWFYSVMNYAKDNTYELVATPEATVFSGITLDNMNACKMYIPLMKDDASSTDTKSTGETAITNVLTDMRKYNELYVIGNGSESGVKGSTNEKVRSMFGGWFHKPSYKDQMWCDGLYMGAALLAQIVNYTKSTTNVDGTSDWNLITKQFTISWNQLYNSEKGLLYHAFTANPKDAASSKWAGISNTEGAEVYHSAAFWGRAMGWYFLALVDVLEQMPSNNSNRETLLGYLNNLAAGLAKYQDASGCWYQVVDQKDEALSGNYLESSCTSLFAAAYLKAVRLGFLTTNGTYNYKTIGVNAFKGAVNQFMKYDTFEPTGTTVQLVHNCASAGLGGNTNRDGSRQYYITGGDVGQTNNYTEGKVMGAFIMAATEYEMANAKAIRFSYDLAPAYTLTKGQSLTVEALGSGDITYKWYNASNDSEVSGATEATFTPTESGKYYCKATNGTTTIQTSTAAVTVAASNSGVIFSYTVNSSEVAANTDYTATGGTVKYGANKYETNGFKSDGDLGTPKYMFVSLSGNTLQEGDVICIKAYSTQSNGGIYAAVNNTASSSYVNLGTLSQKNTVENLSYTVKSSDAINGLSGIYLYRNGVSTYIQEVTITRTASSSSLSITNQPTGETYDVNASSVNELKFEVSTTGTETITYKWYSNTTNSTEGGTLIQNGPSSTYTPPVTTAGTTYYYCIASAGGQSVKSNAAAVAVLNPSDLKTKYNAAWTPIANGTIDVSNLVTSSSKGAYSITSGKDVAQISGTTITALKAGTFTLSQEADDKYKAGSIDITVRIGTDVTSDETNEYSFTAETTDVSDGMTITRKDITMTFGNDGFWSQAPANGYTGGQVNPQVSAYIPTAGTFYKFTPTKPGSLAVKIRLGHLNGKLRPLYVSENGTLIKAKDKKGTELDPENMPAAESTYVDNVTFNVKKGKDYYVYVTGSKLGFYDFVFTTATVYTVTYNMNGHGTQIETVTDDNILPETLPTPTADGYTFVGWYTDAALTKEATPGASISVNTTLYAKWIPITDLFSLTVVRSTTQSVASQTAYDVTSDDATVTGGSAQLYNGHGSNPGDMITGSQINLNGSGASYIKITLDNTLKAGDEIIINPSSSVFNLKKTTDGTPVSFTGSYVIKAGDAVVGQKEIYLYNNKDGNSVIENISISHPESDSRATFKYNGTAIAFSEKTAGDKSAYTTTLEIGAYEKGKTITITPSVKDGASIKQGETVVSGDITIAVPSTIGQTTKSTYTVTSKDETSTTTYEINVKLVKDNVVLVFADSENKTGWTWDKTTNTTQPEFTQPTLTAYLANEDGTASSTVVTIDSNIKYLSDVTDVATVVETTGKITIKSDANGGAKIYAILEGHPDYNDAQTFFNILVKQGYSYSVAGDATIEKGPSLNTSVYIKNGEETLVKMTFGGWKWKTYKDDQDNNKVKSKYLVNGSEKTDQWNAAITSDEETIASIDGYKTSVSGATDAVDEAKEASKDLIYGSTRYGWFKKPTQREDGYLETYPYTLPVRGSYMTFEPTQNGKLTVYILQNGAWNTYSSDAEDGSYKNGDIIPGEFRPHSFYICNQRGLNVSQFSPKTFNVATKQKVQGKYYCDSKSPEKQSDPYNIATWKEFSEYMSTKEQADVEANWNSGINGAQEIVKLDNGSYLAIQKGIVKYTFFVTANETYYLFSNFSKLGFCGANFVPSETVVPDNDDAHKMTLSDETAYPTITKPEASATDEDQYKYKFGGTVKGYVKGFTIPLFKSITLNRTFKKGQWTTLTLPFNLTQTEVEQIFGTGTQILVFQDAQTEGTKLHIKFFYHEIQNIIPGYPYLIKPTLEGYDNGTTTQTPNAPIHELDGSGNLTSFTVYDKAINPNIEQHEFTAISKENYVAKGTPDYCTQALSGVEGGFCKQYEEGDLFISEGNGKLYISKGSSYGKGYRSYIDGPESSATKTLSLSFSGVEDGEDDGTTTEISVAELADDVIEAFGIKGVYNLNGQKVAETTRNLPAGIYVVNGRKVVVK